MKGARHLSKEEIHGIAQSFCGEYEVRNRALFLLGLNIGARISELLALNVGDVWQFGKPVEILELRKAITKGKKTRQIPLNESAREIINELVAWKKAHEEDISPKAPLFVSRKGKGRLTRYQAHRILKDCFKANECSGKVSTHSLRNLLLRLCWFPGIGFAGEKHWLQEKSDDGSVVILEDGSVWVVDPIDRIDSNLWLPTEEIVVTDDDELINIDTGDEVEAERIK